MKTTCIRITALCFILFIGTLSMQAARLNGIRIESNSGNIIVFLNNEQVCSPSSSCFIANLMGGSYNIEVYDARSMGRDEWGRREGLLFSERIHYSGRDVQEIRVGNQGSHYPSRPGGRPHREEGMNSDTFESFYRTVKGATFDSDRIKFIETAIMTSDFTSGQCRRLVDTFSFDSDKVKVMQLMYPRISDKEGFFVVIEGLTFQMDKNKMNDFVRKYHSSRN